MKLTRVGDIDKEIPVLIDKDGSYRDLSKVITMLGLSEHTWMTGNTIRIDGGEDIGG